VGHHQLNPQGSSTYLLTRMSRLDSRRWLEFCDKFTPQLKHLHSQGLLVDVEVRAPLAFD